MKMPHGSPRPRRPTRYPDSGSSRLRFAQGIGIAQERRTIQFESEAVERQAQLALETVYKERLENLLLTTLMGPLKSSLLFCLRSLLP